MSKDNEADEIRRWFDENVNLVGRKTMTPPDILLDTLSQKRNLHAQHIVAFIESGKSQDVPDIIEDLYKYVLVTNSYKAMLDFLLLTDNTNNSGPQDG